MTTIKIAHTACLGCVFARNEGDTQTGCRVGRLEKFRALDPDLVVEAENEQGKFFLVNGRTCNKKRVPPWGENLSEDGALRQVDKEVQIRTAALLVLDDAGASQHEPEKCLRFTLTSILMAAPIPFSEVVLIDNQDKLPRSLLAETMQEFARDSEVPWRLVDVKARTLDGSRVSFGKAIDCGVSHLTCSHYYTVARAGDFIQPSLPQTLDFACNEDLRRFVAATHGLCSNSSGPTVLVKAHRAHNVGGHEQVAYLLEDGVSEVVYEDILDKLRHLYPGMVVAMEELEGAPAC